MSFSDRLKQIRVQKGLSQSELGKIVGVHYTQIGRYEKRGAQPSTDVLSKLADALEVSADFLLHGNTDEAANRIGDKELIAQFRRITDLPRDKQLVVKELIDAFLFKNDIQQKLAQ